ncbi:WD40-repeat-containing domain protein [Entophlyctis helioformis]|nr:WD40-repeat-containing domain protein [Entophlyctis helioformis]
MTTLQTEAPWLASWLAALDGRDAREKTPFVALFPAYNKALELVDAREADLAALKSQLDSLKAILADTSAQLARAQEQGNPDTIKKLADQEAELRTIKDERSELYKTNAGNAQRVLALLDTTKAHEDTIKTLSERGDQLSAINKTLATKLADRDELVKEKDHVIQILRDELSTHQLELVQREEQLRDKEKRVVELEMENKTLLDRWMLLKQKEAAQMNEANDHQQQQTDSMNAWHASTSHVSARPKRAVPALRATSQHGFSTNCGCPQDLAIVPSTARTMYNKTSHDSDINCIRMNRDGSLFATGASDKKVIIYDAKSCTPKTALTGSLQAIMAVAFNSAGDCVLGTSNDNSVKIWSLATSRIRHTLTGHIGKVYAARFTDSNGVVSGSHDRTIKIWDLNKGYCVKTIFTLSSCNDLALLDGDGMVIASGHLDNNLRLWDTRSGNLIREVSGIHFGQITSVEVSPDLSQMLTTSRDNTLKLMDLRTYRTVATFADDGYRAGMNWTQSCFSPDGAYVASGSADGSIFFWEALTGRTAAVLRDQHKSAVCGVAWSPLGGNTVVSASDKDKCIVQWGS